MFSDIQFVAKGKNKKPKYPQSDYQPKGEEKTRWLEVSGEYTLAQELHTKPYEEFNNKSLIVRQNIDQKLFNNFKDEKSDDPDLSWRSNAVRPIARNRSISIAAHLTGNIIVPQTFAQNENQDEDKDAASVMRKLMEWANDQANYVKTFLYAVIAAIVNPGVIVHTEYRETYRTIKDLKEDGTWEKKEVVDEEMSGFQDTIVPLDEIMVGDIYQSDIQKQPFIVWRKVIDFTVAKQKYKDAPNWKFVKPGLQVAFDMATDSFYDQFDKEIQDRLVEEVTYYNRTADLQLCFINGVLVTDPNQPLARKDKKYPFAKSGYEPVDEGKFFYYMSLVRKMADDAEVINELYRWVIDSAKMKLRPPGVVFGEDIISSASMIPGAVTTLQSESKYQQLDGGGDIASGVNVLKLLEASVSESSNDTMQSGQGQDLPGTYGQQALLERNAQIMLGLFGKMIADLVRQIGMLRIGDIVQHLTVADVDELVAGGTLKYRSFFVPSEEGGGKKMNKIMFADMEKMGFSEDEQNRSFDVLAMEGGGRPGDYNAQTMKKGYDSSTRIFVVNPSVFRNLKYRVIVSPDMVTPPSDNLKRALNLELYDRAIMNPYADQEAVFREFLLGSYEASKADPDKFIKKPEEMQMGAGAQALPGQSAPSSVLSKLFGAGSQGVKNKVAQQSIVP